MQIHIHMLLEMDDIIDLIVLGPSIKDVRSQGGFVQCVHFADKGGGSCGHPQMRTSALFGLKNFEFFEIYDVSARIRGEGGLSQCGYFSDKEV